MTRTTDKTRAKRPANSAPPETVSVRLSPENSDFIHGVYMAHQTPYSKTMNKALDAARRRGKR